MATSGIDPSGTDVWIHDSQILNDDDSIAVKPCNGDCLMASCSQNMLIENMVLTGFGASIGSVPPHPAINCVRNITFRNISMPHTGKGVYVKSNPDCTQPNAGRGIIADIVYTDIAILQPRWLSETKKKKKKKKERRRKKKENKKERRKKERRRNETSCIYKCK